MILIYCVNLGLLIFFTCAGLIYYSLLYRDHLYLTAEHLTLPWLLLAKGQGQANE
jgi:hypothetical protein